MEFYIFIIGLTIYAVIGFGKAFIDSIIDFIRLPKPPDGYTWKQCYNFYNNKEYLVDDTQPTVEKIKEEFPREFIMEKLMAYDNQIESYYTLLEQLNHEWRYEKEDVKKARIRTRQADIMLKISNVQEKAYKLREKHGID